MTTAVRNDIPTSSRARHSHPPARQRRRPQSGITLRELLDSSGARVAGDLANLYGDGELEASHVDLERQARRWSKAFQSSGFLGAGI